MSKTTNIAWCDSSWSPWMGCRRVSPGCQHCYIEFATPLRVKGIKHGGPRQRTSESYWKQPLKWNRDANRDSWICDACGKAMLIGDHSTCGKLPYRPRIFPSLCDWLDDEVPIEWLADFLKLIHDTPNLDWLLLTKRPENFIGRICDAATHFKGEATMTRFLERWILPVNKTVPPNVWLGVSVEDQKRADERIPLLLQIPAKVRFLSVEPLLEPIRIYDALRCDVPIHWLIVGGESGKDRRDCGVEAICDVARQCVAAGVPCFVKQDSAFKPGQQGRIPESIWQLKQFPTP